jgi:hypothetical protein
MLKHAGPDGPRAEGHTAAPSILIGPYLDYFTQYAASEKCSCSKALQLKINLGLFHDICNRASVYQAVVALPAQVPLIE